MVDVLADGQGVECPLCFGQCTIGDKEEEVDCPECQGNGVLHPDIDSVTTASNYHDLKDTALMIYTSRERPMLPSEWLSQPALYCEACDYLMPHIAQFEERKQKIDARD